MAILTDRATDRLDQEVIVEWLGEVPGGSGCVDALPHGDLVIGGDEDDRDDEPIDLQLRLKVETAHAAVQVDVQDQAGRADQKRRSEKILSRCEGLGGETGRLHKPAKRSADRAVIVYDGNQVGGIKHDVMALEYSLRSTRMT
jgi:hypothetical protein